MRTKVWLTRVAGVTGASLVAKEHWTRSEHAHDYDNNRDGEHHRLCCVACKECPPLLPARTGAKSENTGTLDTVPCSRKAQKTSTLPEALGD